MVRFAIITSLLIFTSCGTAPGPTRSASQPFSVISEQPDPAAASLTLLIRVPSPATQANVKAAAESAIASRKGDYAHILVKSYLEGMTASDAPFAVSRLEGGVVTHHFSTPGESQKIQTH